MLRNISPMIADRSATSGAARTHGHDAVAPAEAGALRTVRVSLFSGLLHRAHWRCAIAGQIASVFPTASDAERRWIHKRFLRNFCDVVVEIAFCSQTWWTFACARIAIFIANQTSGSTA